MAFEKQIAKAFNLEGENWMKHANPWSIWSRFATLPFLILAIWSRIWLGWYCLIPIVILIIWLKVNPTLFKKPKSFDNWGSKAIFGEKYWTERNKRPVPNHHHTPIAILTMLQFVGIFVSGVGLYKLEIYITLIGAILIYMAKMWFLDRMVWLNKEMQETDENSP